MIKFKLMKVFDCQDMPDNVRKLLYDMYDNGNDTYVSHIMGESDEKYMLVDKWLIENGAEPKSEEVLISYWW